MNEGGLLACLEEMGAQEVYPSLCSNLITNTCVLQPHSIPTSSGKLVIKDQDEAIVLRTRHILIDSGGELHAGSALCPFQGNFSIVLYGRWVDGPHATAGTMPPLDLMRGRLSIEERKVRQQAFSARKELLLHPARSQSRARQTLAIWVSWRGTRGILFTVAQVWT